MKWIKTIATPLTIFSSFVVLGTGLWMYILSKNKILEEVHGQVGLLFFVAVVLHLVVNKTPFFRHFKISKSYLSAIVVLALAGAVIATKSMQTGGEISAGLVFHKLEESRLLDLCATFKVEPNQIIDKMKSEGLAIDNLDMSLAEASKITNKEPRALLKYFFVK